MFGHDTLENIKILTMDEVDKYETSTRTPVDIDVTIFCHGFPCATAKASEIGPTGLRVEIAPFPIAKNTYMEVEFTMHDNKGDWLYRFPVNVGEKNDHAMELLFVNAYVSAFNYTK